MAFQFIFRGIGMKGGGRMMSSKTSISSSPWLMLPPSSEAYKFYSLGDSKVVSINKEAPPLPWAQGRVEYVGSSHGWVASYNLDNRLTFLSDPITGRHIKLPDIHIFPTNIILSSSSHDCRAIMLYNSRIATCFPAHTTTNWLPICGRHDFYYQLVYSTHHNRLFCFTKLTVECWDLDYSPSSFLWKLPLFSDDSESESDESEEDDDDIKISRCNYLKYLVMDEHSGRLFIVIRDGLELVERDGSYAKNIVSNSGGGNWSYPHKTHSFEVYEIDVKEGKIMRYMDASLDGLAMFVGGHNSFALPAADFPHLNLTPDSIYFVENAYNYRSHDISRFSYGGHDIGIFNYVDAKISSIYYPSHASQVSKIALAMWFTPTPH